MIVAVLALFATYDRQGSRISDQHASQLASCERGNRVRRQIRVQNVILQDLVASSAANAPEGLAAVLRESQKRLRDQYNSPDLASVDCQHTIR